LQIGRREGEQQGESVVILKNFWKIALVLCL
jgi:hypothetical protein